MPRCAPACRSGSGDRPGHESRGSRGGACRVSPGGAVHAAARMHRGAGEKEVADRCLGSPEAGRGPEHELLVDLGGAVVDGAAEQARVGRLERRWREDVTGADERPEPGGTALDLGLDAIREPLRLALVPAPGELSASVALHAVGDVCVRPRRFLPRRLAGRVHHRVLTHDQERLVWYQAARELRGRARERVHAVGDVNHAGASRVGRRPRDRRFERPVDLHGRVVALKGLEVRDQARRQVLKPDEVPVQHRSHRARQHGAAGRDLTAIAGASSRP
jgi:hypothetical protein